MDENTISLKPPTSSKELLDFFIHPLNSWKGFLWGVVAVMMMMSIGGLVIGFTKLSASGSNASKQAEAKELIFYSFISLALLGSFTLFAGIFYAVLK